MHKYLKALLIFIFYWWIVGPVINGIVYLATWAIGIKDISRYPDTWIGWVGALIAIALGGFFAVKRIRTNTHWRMTPLRKAIMFGCFYYSVQHAWEILIFGLGDMGHLPEGSSNIVTALDHLILFPSIFSEERFQKGLDISKGLAIHHVNAYLNSAFWSSVFYMIQKIIKKIRANY